MSFATDEIGIYSVTGGGNGDKLNKDNCYFKATGSKYKFVAGGNPMENDVKVDNPFSFDFAGRNWTLTVKSITSTTASGEWIDNGPSPGVFGGTAGADGPGSPDQTFQAQAGTGVRPHGAAKANA
jgi:hypothetical protein